ncbi:MAG: hypothetical protein K1X36_00315 [Pyrinomonadaceae bacterium]|nr:hypothetical protein [Pyrinomonadaceae bacterium]
MKRILWLTVFVFAASMIAFADIPRPEPSKTPKPKPGIDSTLNIRISSDVKEAKLVIPKSQIKQLRAELEKIDNGSDETAEVPKFNGVTRTQTVVSGTLLSLALVFGGIWFVRSGKAGTKAGRTIAVVALVAGVGSAATYVYANAGPPPEVRSITGKIFSQTLQTWKRGSGKIKVETKTDGNSIDLIVPESPKSLDGQE